MSEVRQQLPRRFRVKSYNLRTKPGQTAAQQYGVAFYPTLLITDREGVVRQRFVGVMSPEVLREAIEQVLRE